MSSCGGCAAEVQLEDTFCPRCGASITDPFIGAVVGERYRIVSRIGVGGMGAVYRVLDRVRGKDVALKVMLPSLLAREKAVERFQPTIQESSL